MGSRQYLDEAEKRILKCCEAGAVFLMFDGNWWNGPCSMSAMAIRFPTTTKITCGHASNWRAASMPIIPRC